MTRRRLGVAILLVSTVLVMLIGLTGCLGWHDGWYGGWYRGRDRDGRDGSDRGRQEDRHDGGRGEGGHKGR